MSKVSDLAEQDMQRRAGDAEMFDLKVSYVSTPDAGDDLRATSRIVHAGRRTIVADCRIETSAGMLVATASATFAVKREKEN